MPRDLPTRWRDLPELVRRAYWFGRMAGFAVGMARRSREYAALRDLRLSIARDFAASARHEWGMIEQILEEQAAREGGPRLVGSSSGSHRSPVQSGSPSGAASKETA